MDQVCERWQSEKLWLECKQGRENAANANTTAGSGGGVVRQFHKRGHYGYPHASSNSRLQTNKTAWDRVKFGEAAEIATLVPAALNV